MFARTYLPSKVPEMVEKWSQKIYASKPDPEFVPIDPFTIPDNQVVKDLGLKLESVFSKYYQQPKASSLLCAEATLRHNSEIIGPLTNDGTPIENLSIFHSLTKSEEPTEATTPSLDERTHGNVEETNVEVEQVE